MEKCNLKFGQYLNSDFVKFWNVQTDSRLKQSGTEKAISALKFEKRFDLSIFDRNTFIRAFKANNKYNDFKFNEVSIFEIKYTGEKNQSIKYLIGSCGKKSVIIKYGLGVNGWTVSKEYKINNKKVEKFYDILIKKDKEEYWGSDITEIACLTRIKVGSQINVQVIESLSKSQLDAVINLQSTD